MKDSFGWEWNRGGDFIALQNCRTRKPTAFLAADSSELLCEQPCIDEVRSNLRAVWNIAGSAG